MTNFISSNSSDSIKQFSTGTYFSSSDGKQRFEPFNVSCYLRNGSLCFEVQFLSGSNWSGNAAIFSAPINFGYRSPKYIPGSLYACEAFLNSEITGVEDGIRHLLIEQMSELHMDNESGDFRACFDFISGLYEESVEQRALSQSLPVFWDCWESFNSYMVDNKWVSPGIDGTYKLTPKYQVVGCLTDVSVEAVQTISSDCVITLRDAELTENRIAVEFRSKYTLPNALPSAALQALDYLCRRRPEDEDVVTALVLGSVGWLEWEEYCGGLESLYYDAAELYQKQTGLKPKGIIAEDDFWGHSDKG